MITFYARDIEMWHQDFCFTNDITLTPKEKYHFKTFYDRKELIEFLKSHGVRLDDSNYPLEFIGPKEHPEFGYVCDVIQFSLLGWIKE
jgi:hypothetical protein